MRLAREGAAGGFEVHPVMLSEPLDITLIQGDQRIGAAEPGALPAIVHASRFRLDIWEKALVRSEGRTKPCTPSRRVIVLASLPFVGNGKACPSNRLEARAVPGFATMGPLSR
jgi:hypothetical protein